jgi:hypothetical protein
MMLGTTRLTSEKGEGELKQAWFECGLLYKYSPSQFIDVLNNFRFDSVLICPFQNTPYEDVKIGPEVYDLCNAVDSYAQTHPGFSKFLVVGGASTWLYNPLIQLFKNRNYVMVMDDSGRDFAGTKRSLQYLRSFNVSTGLVVYPEYQQFLPVKDLISECFVDYLMPCFYPFFRDANRFDMFKEHLATFKSWCVGKCKFLPVMQVFGGGIWSFPTLNEVQASVNFLADLNPYGITFFLPHSGQSQRGETFEGFLDHPEIWDIIQKDLPPPTPEPPVPCPKPAMASIAILSLALITLIGIIELRKKR